MKKSLAAFFLALILMVLFKPYYVKDIFHISFQAKSAGHINVMMIYTQDVSQKTAEIPPAGPYEARQKAAAEAQEPDDDTPDGPLISRMFDTSANRHVSFDIPAEHLYRLKIAVNFPRRHIMMGPVTVEGKIKKTFSLTDASGKERGYFRKVKQGRPAAVPFDKVIEAAPKTVFYPAVFTVLFSASFLFFYYLLKSRPFAVFSAAIAGYIAFAVCYDVNLSAANAFTGTMIAAFLFFLYRRTYLSSPRPFNASLAVLSICFGILNILSLSIYNFDSWDLLFRLPVLSLISAMGLAILFYTAGIYFFDFMNSGILLHNSPAEKYHGKFLKLYDTRPVPTAFLIILLCWLPWHILYYPGIISWDVRSQIKQAAGEMALFSQHNPLLSTFLTGGFFRLGQYLKSPELGAYLYILFQSVVCAYVFALCTASIKKMKLRYSFQFCTLFFFAVLPFGGFISVWAVKDILYGALLTLFVLQTVEMLSMEKPPSCGQTAAYALIFLLACLSRHNGVYATFPAAAFLVFTLPGKTALKTGTVVLATFLFLLFLNKILLPAAGFVEESKKEALSIPFQQTARYLKYHAPELTEEEKSAIDSVLNIESIGGVYDPAVSDRVKKTYKLTRKPEEIPLLTGYFKTWFKMFFKHPGTYIQATIANSFGYYAFTPCFLAQQTQPFDNVLYLEQSEKSFHLRRFIQILYSESWTVPFLQLLYTGAFYTWLFLLCAVLLIINKKTKHLIVLIPAGISILVCIASPVNGLLRYYLPVMMCMPFILAFTAAALNKGEKQ